MKLISQKPNIDKIYLYAKDPYEDPNYQFLINEQKSSGLTHFNGSKTFIEYSSNIDNVYKNFEEHNPNKKCKILIVFDDMIADMLSNKKLNSIVTELFIKVPEDVRLNNMHFFYYKKSKQTRASTNFI